MLGRMAARPLPSGQGPAAKTRETGQREDEGDGDVCDKWPE